MISKEHKANQALNRIEQLYKRLGNPQVGDNQVYVGKDFTKAQLVSELNAIICMIR